MGSPSDANPLIVHQPVMTAEAVAGLSIEANETYVDATFGGGGHSRAILERLGRDGRLHVLDSDPKCAAAAAGIDDERLSFSHANFRELASVVSPGAASGVLMDLGISLMQLSDSERGFSLREEGPLDMRLDQSGGYTLGEMLRRIPESKLGEVLRDFGEERSWRRIAAAIVRKRRNGELATTGDIVAACLQGRGRQKWQRLHPATRVFQALRIWVNDELGALREGLEAAATVLRRGGRLVVISFHSLEDRIVKRYLRQQPRDEAPFQQLGKMLRPGKEEVANNRLSRSARLRIGVRQ